MFDVSWMLQNFDDSYFKFSSFLYLRPLCNVTREESNTWRVTFILWLLLLLLLLWKRSISVANGCEKLLCTSVNWSGNGSCQCYRAWCNWIGLFCYGKIKWHITLWLTLINIATNFYTSKGLSRDMNDMASWSTLILRRRTLNTI